MKNRWAVAALVVVAIAALGSAIALASSKSGRTHASRSSNAAGAFSLREGTPVPANLVSDQYKEGLEATGATDQLYLLGQSGDHSYYRASSPDGHTCFAIGGSDQPTQVGCLQSDAEMPTALLDSARVTMSGDDQLLHLVGDEGIAADQVSTVGIERTDGSLVTTPVTDNAYRFPDDAIPSNAVAIVALGPSGAVLERKTLN